MRRIRRWLIPAVLVVGILAGAAVAWRSEARGVDSSSGASSSTLATPVLSVRRAPTILAAQVAVHRLRVDLDAVAELHSLETCLAVTGPGVAYVYRADVRMVPASTQKLLTATAVLDELDPEQRFRTTVEAAAEPVGGVIAGDLTLVGGGDPLLATEDYTTRFERQPQDFTDLDDLAAAIHSAGVRRVQGAVVGDDSRYDRERYVAGWPQRYIDQHSIGPLSALSVNDGFERYPTRAAPGVALEPAADPPAYAAAVLTRLLEARGVAVGGAPRSGTASPDGVEVAAVESAPLVDIVGQMLRESDTNTAELLVKELGFHIGSPTTASGANVVIEAVGALGPSTVIDGSGLSTENKVTCELLLGVLTKEGTSATILERVAVAGESGTLAERFVGTGLEGLLRAKTGSLNGVAALAGVVEDGDPPLTFAFLINADPLPGGTAALQERVGEALAAWPQAPDVAALGPLEGER